MFSDKTTRKDDNDNSKSNKKKANINLNNDTKRITKQTKGNDITQIKNDMQNKKRGYEKQQREEENNEKPGY